jgi:hypothetical protein
MLHSVLGAVKYATIKPQLCPNISLAGVKSTGILGLFRYVALSKFKDIHVSILENKSRNLIFTFSIFFYGHFCKWHLKLFLHDCVAISALGFCCTL